MELNDALDQLVTFGDVQARPVPGGHGLARDGVVFAVFNDGRLYFHTDDESRAAYVERGMEAYSLRPGAGTSRYYEVPVEVFGDPQTLVEWARRALASRPTPSRGERPAGAKPGRRSRVAPPPDGDAKEIRSARSSGVAPSPSRPG
jgi:DNA transformation protein and related proteins